MPPSSILPYLDRAALALVFLGGLAGTGVRYAIESAMPFTGTQWPWATFGINLSGAFLLGVLLESLIRRGPDGGGRRRVRLLMGTGFFGAYTTYSTFALEMVQLADRGAEITALGYGFGSAVAGVGCAWLGFVVAGWLADRRGESVA